MISNPRKPSRSAYSINGFRTSPPGQHSYHRISFSRMWMVLRRRCLSLDHGYQADGVESVALMRPSGKSGRYSKPNMGTIQMRPFLSSAPRHIPLSSHDSNIPSHTSSSFDLQRTRPLPLDSTMVYTLTIPAKTNPDLQNRDRKQPDVVSPTNGRHCCGTHPRLFCATESTSTWDGGNDCGAARSLEDRGTGKVVPGVHFALLFRRLRCGT